jgi:3-hydroxybutyrate dehydrogenase
MTEPPLSLHILITGAGSGLGRDLGVYFAGKGHRLFLTDLDPAAVDQTRALAARAAGDLGGPVLATAHALDVSSPVAVSAFFAEVGGERVDVLVNNAGLQHVSPIADFPVERWDRLIAVMLTGPFLMTRAVLPRMRARGFGRIVNVGSIHSLVASPYKAAYVAAKHGLLGLTRVAALEAAEWPGADVTVNVICPSYVRTPLVDAQIKAQAAAHGIPEQEVIDRIMLAPMPKRRFVTAEEVAAAIEFLAGPGGRNVTGQSLVLDGGWTAR